MNIFVLHYLSLYSIELSIYFFTNIITNKKVMDRKKSIIIILSIRIRAFIYFLIVFHI